jgi:hypothetical protein
VSRWLGHSDGGALAMRVYGHLQVEHSLAMGKRVSFDAPSNVIPMPQPTSMEVRKDASATADERRAIAKAKAKYSYPWWASENPLEVFWGQLNEETLIVPTEKLLEIAKQTMGREMFKQELANRQVLMDELVERVPEATLREAAAKIATQRQDGPDQKQEAAK